MECLWAHWRAELELERICTNCRNYMKKHTYVRLICNNQQCKHKLRGEIQPGSTSAGKDPKGGCRGCGRSQNKQNTTISYCCEKKNPVFIWVCIDWVVLWKMCLVNLLLPLACATELGATPQGAHSTSKKMWPLGQNLELCSRKNSGLHISEVGQKHRGISWFSQLWGTWWEVVSFTASEGCKTGWFSDMNWMGDVEPLTWRLFRLKKRSVRRDGGVAHLAL